METTNNNTLQTAWIKDAVQADTKMLGTAILSILQVDELAEDILRTDIDDIIYGDLAEWTSNLLFSPFDLRFGETGTLYYAKRTFNNILAYPIAKFLNAGLDLGEFHYKPKFNDFRDYEPYTKLQIYLPFYHYVDIPVCDVLNKYIQFRLYIDFKTGLASYVIGVSDSSIKRDGYNFGFPSVVGVNDYNTRIIGRYEFQLCSSIPIGKTGMTDATRNMVIAGLRTVANIASVYLTGGASSVSTAVTTGNIVESTSDVLDDVKKVRGDSGRLQTSSRDTLSEVNTKNRNINRTTTKRIEYQSHKNFNQSFNSSIDCLQAMHLQANIGVANNTTLDSACPRCIKIVRKCGKFIETDSNFNRLYGKPLGDVRYLSSLKGYTEVTQIFFNGDEFNTITEGEKSMLYDLFKSGVIL